MRDQLSSRICTIVATVLRVPPQNVRPEASLALVSRKKLAIAESVRRLIGIHIDDSTAEEWSDVADIIATAEHALERAKTRRAAA